MGIVYKITNNINGKVYVGKSKRLPSIRWAEHQRYAREANRTNLIYLAIRKYGIENFSFEVIENNIPDSLLAQKECEYIKQFNSFHNGYNETVGGEGESPVDTEELIALYIYGNNYSEIASITGHTRKTVSSTLRSLGYYPKSVNGNNKGKGKQVVFDGVEYRSITQLAEFLHNNYDEFSDNKISTIVTGIHKVLSGVNKSYYGYSFSYLQ